MGGQFFTIRCRNYSQSLRLYPWIAAWLAWELVRRYLSLSQLIEEILPVRVTVRRVCPGYWVLRIIDTGVKYATRWLKRTYINSHSLAPSFSQLTITLTYIPSNHFFQILISLSRTLTLRVLFLFFNFLHQSLTHYFLSSNTLHKHHFNYSHITSPSYY